jgi:Holliday junction DNA helicase RuvA
MIGKLKGTLDSVGEDHLILDVHGVGYLVHASARTLGGLPAVGEALTLSIETHVREDMIRLFGFPTDLERDWFRLLQSVQGVGAKVALAVQSVLSPGDLASAIALQDKAMVGRANGVGPKLALRLVTELKGKVPTGGGIDAGTLGLQAALGEGVAPTAIADAVSALTNLGYSSAQASAALARIVAREGDGVKTETLIRMGLRELSS